jgi:hypothetical protein
MKQSMPEETAPAGPPAGSRIAPRADHTCRIQVNAKWRSNCSNNARILITFNGNGALVCALHPSFFEIK